MRLMSRTAPAAWGTWPIAAPIVRDAMTRATRTLLARLRHEPPSAGDLRILLVEPRTTDEFTRLWLRVNAESVLIGWLRLSDGRAWEVHWHPVTRTGRLRQSEPRPIGMRGRPTITEAEIAHGLELAALVLAERFPEDTVIERHPSAIAEAEAIPFGCGSFEIGHVQAQGDRVAWSAYWNPLTHGGGIASPMEQGTNEYVPFRE